MEMTKAKRRAYEAMDAEMQQACDICLPLVEDVHDRIMEAQKASETMVSAFDTFISDKHADAMETIEALENAAVDTANTAHSVIAALYRFEMQLAELATRQPTGELSDTCVTIVVLEGNIYYLARALKAKYGLVAVRAGNVLLLNVPEAGGLGVSFNEIYDFVNSGDYQAIVTIGDIYEGGDIIHYTQRG